MARPKAKVCPPPSCKASVTRPRPARYWASSFIAMTVAPVLDAMTSVSPRWSPWACERTTKSASTWSGERSAMGLPLRKGSIQRRAPLVSISQAA